MNIAWRSSTPGRNSRPGEPAAADQSGSGRRRGGHYPASMMRVRRPRVGETDDSQSNRAGQEGRAQRRGRCEDYAAAGGARTVSAAVLESEGGRGDSQADNEDVAPLTGELGRRDGQVATAGDLCAARRDHESVGEPDRPSDEPVDGAVPGGCSREPRSPGSGKHRSRRCDRRAGDGGFRRRRGA